MSYARRSGSTRYPLPARCKALPLVLAVGASSLALAQDRVIEEVVVSAQKREQSMQDVSIAVSAFSEEELNSLAVSNLEELTEFVSGVELFDDRGAGQPTWVIRGVGLADFNANNTPTAAIHYDDYYLTSNVLGGIGLFDIGRVEVLKGPQGGLYGRNSSGGAVQVLSRRAEVGAESNGYLTGSYGRWGRHGLEAAFGGKLGDSAAFRVAAMTDQDGGWQDSLVTPQDDEHGDRDFSAVRVQLSWQPTENIDAWLKIEGGADKSETTLAYSRALYDLETGDFCSAALAGRQDELNCVTLSNLTNAFVLTPGDPGILPGGQSESGTRVLSSPINAVDNDWLGVNLQLNWDLGAVSLTSITGYLDYDAQQVYDFDGQPLVLFEEDSLAQLDSWSQEFRLVSNSDGSLGWLAGAMYAEDEDEELRIGTTVENVLIFPSQIERSFTQKTQSWALYGQLDYAFNEAWALTASLRYTDEDKDMNNYTVKDVPGDFFYLENVNTAYELDENWSGHVGLDWTPMDDVMVYTRVTQGFKSGGFFGGFSLTPAEVEPYAEETVVSVEVGFKTMWAERTVRLNGAAFYYDYQDVQGFTQVFSPISGTVVTKLGNLGDAEHTGAELDLLWLPLEGLTLQASLSWLDAEISDSDTLALSQEFLVLPIEGLKRGFAPEWSSNVLARYEWDTGGLRAAVQANYSWRDDLVNEESSLTPVNLAAFGHESYGLLNARVSLGAADDSWNVALVGRNLSDTEYWARTSGDDLGSFPSTPGRPMSWLVEATYQW